MQRRLFTAILAALALVALSVPALAKGGAVTKFDSLPTDWHAGQVYTLGYLIKMDGVEPYKADRTEIIANSLDGKTSLVFPGVGDMTPFDMGSISVLPAIASLATSSTPAAPVGDPLSDAMPFAAAGAAIFAAFVLSRTQRRRLIRTA